MRPARLLHPPPPSIMQRHAQPLRDISHPTLIQHAPVPCAGMPLLRQLSLRSCDLLEGPGLQHLALLAVLETLDLRQCGG